jgi:hypothetical protein
MVPLVDGEVGVSTAKDGHKVIFEGPDGSFRRVSSMKICWCQLEVYFLVGEEFA